MRATSLAKLFQPRTGPYGHEYAWAAGSRVFSQLSRGNWTRAEMPHLRITSGGNSFLFFSVGSHFRNYSPTSQTDINDEFRYAEIRFYLYSSAWIYDCAWHSWRIDVTLNLKKWSLKEFTIFQMIWDITRNRMFLKTDINVGFTDIVKV